MQHAPSLSPRTSLARSTLIKMGVRIAVVIALAILASYLHMFQSLRTQPLVQLERHVSERSEREQALFVLAEDNHALLVLPEREVSSVTLRGARYVLVFGLVSLLLELAILHWVLKQQITRPLLSLPQATDKVAAGDFQADPGTSRNDELGQLAHSFRTMTGEVQRREEALRQANEGLEQRPREPEEVHQQLVDTARKVGRAEVATNVLHNVGNVLNSVNTSALLAKERLAGMKLDSLSRLVGLFEKHQDNLVAFLIEDERGRNVLPFLNQLGKYMQEERQELHTLLGDISRHTAHIAAIVKDQQRHARAPLLHEPVELAELMEEALRINLAALDSHSIQVERNLASLPSISTEKHKVLMILVNLISNARHTLQSVPPEERRLRGSLALQGARVRIEVRDNGEGIAPELRTRIFQHGFTTREEGHGFGLHSSALAAQELGGSLTVHSDGLGHGATFALELPASSTENSIERAHG